MEIEQCRMLAFCRQFFDEPQSQYSFFVINGYFYAIVKLVTVDGFVHNFKPSAVVTDGNKADQTEKFPSDTLIIVTVGDKLSTVFRVLDTHRHDHVGCFAFCGGRKLGFIVAVFTEGYFNCFGYDLYLHHYAETLETLIYFVARRQ